MSHLQYFDYEGFGDRSKRDINYSQAVRIDNRIELSGQGKLKSNNYGTPELKDSRWLGSSHRGNS